MRAIDIVKGSGVPLRGNDIDTDRIIPSRFLKCVTFEGLGEHAFADDIKGLAEKGEVHPFRDSRYAQGKVLVSNSNFGCGSSREHAPQAIKRWGVEAIIAESYSEIFYGNCVAIGMPCFKASHETCEKLLAWIEANPAGELVTSTDQKTVTFDGETLPLDIAEGPRGQFLDGSWHARSVLLSNMDKIKSVAATLPYVDDYR